MTSTPLAIDLLISARWIAPVEPAGLLTDHALAIDGGRIVDLLPAPLAHRRYQPRERVQLPDHILLPGLVNLHTHAAMSLMRGLADDLPLMTWLQEHIWPTEAQHVSHRFVADGTLLAAAEMLQGGVTCFSDMYFHPAAAAEAAAALGMRAMIGITTLEFPTPYAHDADDYLAKGLAARERWLDHPLIGFTLAPHAPYTVTDTSFQRILTLSEQLGLPIHCHIHETRQEIADSLAQHGVRPLRRLERLGLLGPNFIGVHAVHLDEDDMALLAGRGCHIAHCPASNLKLASGFASVAKMRQYGINVGIGTDGAASNNRLDVLGETRLAALLAKGVAADAAALPAAEALRMATLAGAQALGIGHLTGSLLPGKWADLCALSLAGLECRPIHDPLASLIHAADRRDITHVWVGGKCCVDNKKIQLPAENPLEPIIALWQNRLEIRRGTAARSLADKA